MLLLRVKKKKSKRTATFKGFQYIEKTNEFDNLIKLRHPWSSKDKTAKYALNNYVESDQSRSKTHKKTLQCNKTWQAFKNTWS